MKGMFIGDPALVPAGMTVVTYDLYGRRDLMNQVGYILGGSGWDGVCNNTPVIWKNALFHSSKLSPAVCLMAAAVSIGGRTKMRPYPASVIKTTFELERTAASSEKLQITRNASRLLGCIESFIACELSAWYSVQPDLERRLDDADVIATHVANGCVSQLCRVLADEDKLRNVGKAHADRTIVSTQPESEWMMLQPLESVLSFRLLLQSKAVYVGVAQNCDGPGKRMKYILYLHPRHQRELTARELVGALNACDPGVAQPATTNCIYDRTYRRWTGGRNIAFSPSLGGSGLQPAEIDAVIRSLVSRSTIRV